MGTEKLSTRFVSVQVKGRSTGLFEAEPPEVCVEVRARGKVVSKPVSASYGFDEATGSAQLRLTEANPRELEPNTIALMITEEPNQKTVSLHLLDAASDAELAKRDKIEVAIAF